MAEEILYIFASVFVVSFVSFVGVATLSIKPHVLKRILMYLVSFSAGALIGDAFIHLLPEAVEKAGFGTGVSFAAISGILSFFTIEKFIHWRHCHANTDDHIHTFAYMNLIGDGVHNFIDGVVVAGSYLVSIPLGIATTIAVVAHEIPQEIGDFGILLHGGFTARRALFYNFLSAITAVLGAAATLMLSSQFTNILPFIIPFTAGGFLYIAGSDLIPELHKETKTANSIIQLASIIAGVFVMLALLALE